jgi:hypothetical protein
MVAPTPVNASKELAFEMARVNSQQLPTQSPCVRNRQLWLSATLGFPGPLNSFQLARHAFAIIGCRLEQRLVFRFWIFGGDSA